MVKASLHAIAYGSMRLRFIRMSKVCESWSLEELCDMDEEDMNMLLNCYEKGNVPKFEEIRLNDDSVIGFDGSFGWW